MTPTSDTTINTLLRWQTAAEGQVRTRSRSRTARGLKRLLVALGPVVPVSATVGS